MANQTMTRQAYNPEECNYILCEAMRKGDVDLILDLYESGAIWYSLVSGNPLTREEKTFQKEYMWLTARNATMKLEKVNVIRNLEDTVASVRIIGIFEGRDPDGKEVIIPFDSNQVVRKQKDGTWKIAIDEARRVSRN
ncbi:MAG: hypothetical protein RR202_00655 [Bacteroidales bacterium]